MREKRERNVREVRKKKRTRESYLIFFLKLREDDLDKNCHSFLLCYALFRQLTILWISLSLSLSLSLCVCVCRNLDGFELLRSMSRLSILLEI